MEWVYLFLAGLLEMLGVFMMNQWHQKRNWSSVLLLAISFAMSFYLLSLAMNTLPMGVAYAVWTGIGTAGGVLVGIIWYGESRHWKRMACIALIVVAAIGLRLTS